MAQLRDIPVVWRTMGPLPFCKKVWNEINDDALFTWASALAYSWLFAIFPFFLVLLSLLPLLKYQWRVSAKHAINDVIRELPREAQETVHEYLDPRLNALLFDKPAGWSGI